MVISEYCTYWNFVIRHLFESTVTLKIKIKVWGLVWALLESSFSLPSSTFSCWYFDKTRSWLAGHCLNGWNLLP